MTTKTIPANQPANIRRRVSRARNHPGVTCPASRHLHLLADQLSGNRPDIAIHDIEGEPEHVAVSIYAVLESLWKLRREPVQAEVV